MILVFSFAPTSLNPDTITTSIISSIIIITKRISLPRQVRGRSPWMNVDLPAQAAFDQTILHRFASAGLSLSICIFGGSFLSSAAGKRPKQHQFLTMRKLTIFSWSQILVGAECIVEDATALAGTYDRQQVLPSACRCLQVFDQTLPARYKKFLRCRGQ